MRFLAKVSLYSTVLTLLLAGASFAQEAKPKGEGEKPAGGNQLTDAEQAFINQLANHVMVGTFSVDGREQMAPNPERYEIGKVIKAGTNLFTIEARMKYGTKDATFPVTVFVYWANDTPMISVTDMAIPLVGSEFGARILFHGDRYAGTWQHGKVGGHMMGKLEAKPTEEKVAPATPAVPGTN